MWNLAETGDAGSGVLTRVFLVGAMWRGRLESANITYVVLNAVFGLALLAVARLALGRRGSPILWAYVIVTIVFVYALPVQEYSTNLTLEVVLLSHLLMLPFFATVLFLARTHTMKMKDLGSVIMNVPSWAFFVVAGAWLLWRLQLIWMRGPGALMFSRAQYSVSFGILELSTWEVALSSITSLLLMGGMALLVVCHAAGQQGRSRLGYFVAVAMLAVVILTNESPVGSRRLLLILAALWFRVSWVCSGLSLTAYIAKHAKKAGVLVLLMVSLAVYYQHIRNNDFSRILDASSPGEVLAATLQFVTTMNADAEGNEVKYLRGGPFDFFAKVVDASVAEGKSTNGEATLFSLALAMPKAVYPGVKPVGDVDEVLLEHLGIYPTQAFLQVDYPTSLPVIGLADFGPVGVIGAGAVLGACFIFVSWWLRWTRSVPFAPFLMLGLFIQLMGSQETGLTAILSAPRDAAVAVLVLVVFRKVARLFYSVDRRGVPCPPSAEPVPAKMETP